MQLINTAIFSLMLFMFNAAADENGSLPDERFPLSEQEIANLIKQQEAVLAATPVAEPPEMTSPQVHSRRGDALFFLGRFKESVAEYQAMVLLDPALDESHWRLGIALFFADMPDKAVAQFEKYHSFDNVDRENGIWRYLSQYKATNAATAKKELIRYNKDDREPFPAVYKLFDESLSPKQAIDNIPDSLPHDEHEKRLFYTELYIGMHLIVKNKPNDSQRFLRRAVSRKWPRTAGFGPNYMWHVGRIQLNLLLQNQLKPTVK